MTRKRLGFVKPVVTAAGIFALSGVAMAQREGDAKNWMGGISHELVAIGFASARLKPQRLQI